MKLIHIKRFFKGEYSINDIIDFFRGNIRYWLWYNKYKLHVLIPLHIRQQINMRINIMDKECYNSGSCKLCGCKTTHLQMANKSCEKPCYPPIMKKKVWKTWISSKEEINKLSIVVSFKKENHYEHWVYNNSKPIYWKADHYNPIIPENLYKPAKKKTTKSKTN